MRTIYDDLVDMFFTKPIAPKTINSTDLVKVFTNSIDFIYQNKKKGAFGIKFKNGTNITVHLQKGDKWDSEKALLMCYVKWLNGGKGNFNDIFDVLEGVVDSDKE